MPNTVMQSPQRFAQTPPMQFNPGLHSYQPNMPLQQKGEKKKVSIPTWLIILILIISAGIIGLIIWLT